MTIFALGDDTPQIDDSAYAADGATIIGAMPSGTWSAPRAKVCAPPGTNSCRRRCRAAERSNDGVATVILRDDQDVC